MADGQNLSDLATAFAGTWRLDEVLRTLAPAGIEPIVVGVHNTRDRLAEYSPFPHRKYGGGAGDSYLSFVVETVKPRIDRRFRTRPAASATVVAGSSMGGLISLYAWFRRQDAFGHAVVMSPSLWYGRDRLVEFVAASRLPRGRLYLDVGTGEGADTLRDVRSLKALLEKKGIDGCLAYVEDRRGCHDEESWSRRIGGAFEFVLQPGPKPRGK